MEHKKINQLISQQQSQFQQVYIDDQDQNENKNEEILEINQIVDNHKKINRQYHYYYDEELENNDNYYHQHHQQQQVIEFNNLILENNRNPIDRIRSTTRFRLHKVFIISIATSLAMIYSAFIWLMIKYDKIDENKVRGSSRFFIFIKNIFIFFYISRDISQ